MVSTKERVSIGVVGRLTGLSAETLRNWERRYGFPVPERTQGGQRVYALETVDRLRLITQALERGWRAGEVVPMELSSLKWMLNGPPGGRFEQAGHMFMAEPHAREHTPAEVASLLDATRAMDGVALDELLRRCWYRLGAVTFLEEIAGRFVWEVGEAWFDGRLSIAQEHFASERLRDFLASQWRPLSDSARGPAVICAALPGEQHVLGLHMAATLIAISGWRVLFLGADIPISEIAQTADQLDNPRAVLLSVSQAAHSAHTRRAIEGLRAKLPAPLDVIVGGVGAPGGLDGCHRMASFIELTGWLAAQLRAPRA
jgi:methanogenic corrinoid protein MtbC1